jgi:hypothetical protein
MAAFRSNDNDQAGPIGGLTDFDGDPTDYLDEGQFGTSFSAAAAGGAAALVRDYFAKGFYPGGSVAAGREEPTISGALVKAALIAGANYEDVHLLGAPGRFNYLQGYGRIHLANSLPLANYPEALLPDPRNHAEALGVPPTVPLGSLAVDEYFDGGQGLGIVSADETRTYTVNVIDPARQLRVALAYADAPGDLLEHDLDLTVVAPGFVDTDGIPDPSLDGASCDGSNCARLAYSGNQVLGVF